MTKHEREEILREFREAKAIVQKLDSLTRRIEIAADKAIEAYGSSQGVDKNGPN